MKIYRRAKKQILAAAFIFVAAFAWSQDTSFHELVKTATPWEIRAALKIGADINARDEYGLTLLMWAAKFQDILKVITTLLDAGADAKTRNIYNNTVFDYAKGNDHLSGTDVYWRLNDARF